MLQPIRISAGIELSASPDVAMFELRARPFYPSFKAMKPSGKEIQDNGQQSTAVWEIVDRRRFGNPCPLSLQD